MTGDAMDGPTRPLAIELEPAEVEARLEALGVERVERDLRSLDGDALAARFGSERSGRVVLSRLLRSVIWQARGRILSGEEPPVHGNLRTFWYRFVKPVIAHLGAAGETRSDPYDLMLAAFVDLVVEQGVMRYAELDFTDENWEHRRVATERPEVLVFAEKTGWVRTLREVHQRWGVTTLALGGAPSALTSEYTVSHLRERWPEVRSVRLIGIVDHDPAGHMIAGALGDQLAAFGLASEPPELLIHPRHYTADERAMFSYPLPRPGRTRVQQWLSDPAGGGVDGQPRGLESESLPRDRLLDLLAAALDR